MNFQTLGVAALASGLLGCGGPIRFTDDMDGTFDFDLTRSDDLNAPYVRGAEVGFTLRSHRDLRGWTVRSSDDTVFLIQDTPTLRDDRITLDGLANATGRSELRVYDERGTLRDAAPIEVRLPTHLQLFASGPLFAELGADEAYDNVPQILVGGTASFQVRYFYGLQQLSGNAVLTVQVDHDGLTTETTTTWLSESREWLRLSPTVVGHYQLSLWVDGVPMGRLQVEAVPEEAIARVELMGSDAQGATPDDPMVVVAMAYDIDGDPIWGVDYGWQSEGLDEQGLGDLYRYSYDPTEPNLIVARVGPNTDNTTVYGEGYVDSSNDLGCATTPARATGAMLLWSLLLVSTRRGGHPRR